MKPAAAAATMNRRSPSHWRPVGNLATIGKACRVDYQPEDTEAGNRVYEAQPGVGGPTDPLRTRDMTRSGAFPATQE